MEVFQIATDWSHEPETRNCSAPWGEGGGEVCSTWVEGGCGACGFEECLGGMHSLFQGTHEAQLAAKLVVRRARLAASKGRACTGAARTFPSMKRRAATPSLCPRTEHAVESSTHRPGLGARVQSFGSRVLEFRVWVCTPFVHLANTAPTPVVPRECALQHSIASIPQLDGPAREERSPPSAAAAHTRLCRFPLSNCRTVLVSARWFLPSLPVQCTCPRSLSPRSCRTTRWRPR